MDLSPWLTVFQNVTADYYEYARNAAAQGRKVAGYFCSYVPQELLYGAGYLPIRILGRVGATSRADELLQSFSCSFARSVLDTALEREWPFLSLTLFAHTCDTMQNVADLWRAHTGDSKTIIVSIPTRVDTEAAAQYYSDELQRVRSLLEEDSGPIAEDAIQQAFDLYQGHRATMNELYRLHAEHPGLLTGTQLMEINLAGQLMDRAEHLAAVKALIAAFQAVSDLPDEKMPRVFVWGSMCRHTAFIELIEQAGCRVVGDDLCVGSRSYAPAHVEGATPMESVVRYYLARAHCPAFHRDMHHPGTALVEAAQRYKAQGVIFLMTNFCDPTAFDYVPITQALEKADIPSLTLSVEQHQEPPEQLRTRVEAFAEMLQGSAVS